jgi:hypothetical protein
MDERSAQRRSPSTKVPPYRNKRFLAILAAALTFGVFVTVTQVSNAGERRRGQRPPAAVPCPPAATSTGAATQPGNSADTPAPPDGAGAGTAPSDPLVPTTGPNETDGPGDTPAAGANGGVVNGGQQNGRQVRNYPNDQGDANSGVQNRRGQRPCVPAAPASTSASASSPANPPTNPGNQGNLGTDCENSDLEAHTGFQDGNRCVGVSHGEVPTIENGPSLLITRAPQFVRANQPFTLRVSTRNLVRDRFLAAATGGYYAEASFLTADGLVRGHLHTSCRMLASTREAPDPAVLPAFFVATEDGGGSKDPDSLTISVPGLPQRGIAQCAVWAGDGGHRTPMMQRAQQQPAFDSVRVRVG